VSYGLAGALVVLVPLVSNFERCNRRGFYLAREYGESILYSLPPNSILFTDGDNETFILGYLKKVEGMRPDVQVFNRKGYLFDDIYGLQSLPRPCWGQRQAEVEKRFLTQGSRRVFFTSVPGGLGCRFRPAGLVYLAETGPEPAKILPGWAFTPEEVLERPAKYDFITRKFCITPYQVEAELAMNEGDYERALYWYARCARVGFDFPEARYNLGLLAWANGNFVSAAQELSVAAKLEPAARYPHEKLQTLLSFGTVSTTTGGTWPEASRW
jgi:hypothetical protein